ncbi:Anp1-domain-containing protein [Absidia repens]|uniref:Anp1-domain-containing protein n=1 Tax=Absidia repens TaxID=90262 RepID=A0A1X2I3Y1_9FUNG|nr:Anp1-domain-containing protein [Absidia repens]
MTSLYTFRGGKRLVMVLGLMTCLFLFAFNQANTNTNTKYNTSNTMCHNTRSLSHSPQKLSWRQRLGYLTQPYYRDLNALDATSKAIQNQERILVLTPLFQNNAEEHLSRYFELLDQSTYPNHLISIGLLVSSSTSSTQAQHDDMITTLTTLVHRLQRRWFHAFHEINIYQRDFHFDFDIDHHSGKGDTLHHSSSSFKLQPYRRSIMARARNYLLSAALEDDHSWVAWMDVDVIDYPPTIFEDLMRHDVDVIVPNCLLPTKDHSFWAYDRNNWQETDGSMRFQMSVGEDFVMLEGYKELATGRTLLVDMPTHLGHNHLVPLDGVGTSFTLVKAIVHREGANFPSFAFQHQVDTEGFAKIAKAMGFGIFGIPSYFIYHAHP